MSEQVDYEEVLAIRLTAERDSYREQASINAQLLACAYQLAGVVGAPLRFLDAFSNLKGDIEELLPVGIEECDEFKALIEERNDYLQQAEMNAHVAEVKERTVREQADYIRKIRGMLIEASNIASNEGGYRDPQYLMRFCERVEAELDGGEVKQ